MVVVKKKNDYWPYMCKFVGWKHEGDRTFYVPATTAPFSMEQLLEITPNDVCRYFG